MRRLSIRKHAHWAGTIRQPTCLAVLHGAVPRNGRGCVGGAQRAVHVLATAQGHKIERRLCDSSNNEFQGMVDDTVLRLPPCA